MILSEFLAGTKKAILEDLVRGEPPTGRFDEGQMDNVKKAKGVQIGATVLSPGAIDFEFLVLEDSGQSIFVVQVDPPQRIVFLPVPSWVVDSVWQGEVDGSYHFESDALRLIDEFRLKTGVAENAELFHEKHVIGRQ